MTKIEGQTFDVSTDMVQEIADRGRQSFYFFVKAILGFNKIDRDIHRPICQTLQNFEKNPRVLVMLPRDWYKTTIASISYSIWRAVQNPEIRILIVQNTYTNAVSKLTAIKSIFEKNELFRACYPDILPDNTCIWKADSLCVKRKGSYPESTFEAAGTATQVTSRHYDLIIEDDTVAPEFDSMTGVLMQPSQAEIEKAIGWHRLAHPLLIEPAESMILVIGTRWVEGDLLEWVMKNEKSYVVACRAVQEDDEGHPSKDGNVVWEKRFPVKVLAQLEEALGPYMYSALYLNSPMAASNQVFKREWLRYYETVPDDILVCTAVDPAASDKDNSSDPDYNVVLTIGVARRTGCIYVLHYDRGRMNPGELIDSMFRHHRAFVPLKFKIETISYQRTLSYWLNKRMMQTNQFFPIEEISSHKGSKSDRIRGLQPFFASGKILIKPEMTELISELLAFDKGKHDDVIDALSMLLDFFAEAQEARLEYSKANENDNMFDSLLDELRNRSVQKNRFPFDVGLVGDRDSRFVFN
jgi:predicted phage terminase large subunit-like protein